MFSATWLLKFDGKRLNCPFSHYVEGSNVERCRLKMITINLTSRNFGKLWPQTCHHEISRFKVILRSTGLILGKLTAFKVPHTTRIIIYHNLPS